MLDTQDALRKLYPRTDVVIHMHVALAGIAVVIEADLW
jgi:hypothetical protein